MKKLTPDKQRRIISLISSLLLHLFFFAMIIISGISSNQLPKINRQTITLESVQIDESMNQEMLKENISEEIKTKDLDNKPKEEFSESNITIVNPNDLIADTTNLDQVYSEKTLNLSIKYPRGWTFIDQTKKNKLDGVTFWSAEGIYNPPPYIHLEVIEKYLFNPARYKYKVKQFNCEWYFNDPINLEGQVSQEIYIRTEIDEDFLIKLIMKGEEQFRSFQSKFFAIVKSLDYNKGLF
ncbi:MAG: hypothetical protein N3D80_09290 [Ignavibacterium album]|jgi:hypothetical protein|uniref:hypothetical protein n=1 Tax=Ignavibacterium album TaxID=591197 RepID=UPI0026EC7CE4|nr:hypothetical protein [Ignavibacterium album]MCX8106049.1 hypothetical protein [Ignavibacterium album]